MNHLRPRKAKLYLLGHTVSQSSSKDDPRASWLSAQCSHSHSHSCFPFLCPIWLVYLPHLCTTFSCPLLLTCLCTHTHTHTHTLWATWYIFRTKLLKAAFLLSYYAVSLYLSELWSLSVWIRKTKCCPVRGCYKTDFYNILKNGQWYCDCTSIDYFCNDLQMIFTNDIYKWFTTDTNNGYVVNM